jgi:nitronate monooxygenase
MAWFDTRLARLVGTRYPLIQAPMAGVNTPELVAAVSNAGGLGSLGGAMLSPDALREQLAAVRALTSEPFAVNLFAPLTTPEAPDAVAAMLERIAPRRQQLGLGPGVAPPTPSPQFEAQLEVLLSEPPAAFSITFGLTPSPAQRALHEAGVTVIGTATTSAEAVAVQDAGCDAVAVQGSEAGGHRGTFATDFDAALVGTMALVPQVRDRVDVPVIAAGGIMDGRGIAAALALGADGVQMGTAFIGCSETRAPAAYVDTLAESTDGETVVTPAFTGRPARALRTEWVTEMEASGAEPAPYPVQAMLLAELRAAGLEQGELDLVMRLAGQGAPMLRRGSAADLVGELAAETEAALARAAGGPLPPAERH